jgi:hypothetical protein
MSDESREANDTQGLSEVLAVFSQIARNASEAAEAEARRRRMDRSEVLAVFSELARNAGETEAPDQAGTA